jgi:integrase
MTKERWISMAVKFTKLTRPEMRKTSAGDKIEEHGVVYTRLANGDGRFSVNVMVDGERVHRVIGKESEGVTREQAENFIAKLRTDAREGRLNLPKGRKIAVGFKEAAEKYLKKLSEEGGKDIKAKTRRLNQHLIPFFGNQSLSKIVTSDVKRYGEQRSKELAISGGDKNKPLDQAKLKTTSNGTINRELAVLSHLFNQAVEWKWIQYRPAKIVLLKEEEGRDNYLTKEQVVLVKEMATHDENPLAFMFINIGLDTSMRKSEILAIRIEHIDLERRIIYIPNVAGVTKTGSREQPITKRLAAYLEAELEKLPSEQVWLFPSSKSATGHITNIDKAFRRVIVAAGLDPSEIVRHTMRHTVVTHLVQDGIDLPTVMKISGHKTLAMILKYSHRNGEHVQEAMDRLERRLDIAA